MNRPDHHQLASALRAHARGLYCIEAAVELLIGHQSWLRRDDFTTTLIQMSPKLTNGATLAHVDWPAAITALDTGQLPCSGGEGRMLRIAASVADGIPADLRDALTGLDTTNTTLVTQAITHAAGHHPRPDKMR
jgi:hypothetical protein